MFKLIRFIYLLIMILAITSCNDENITPIRTRKIAPKVSSAFKSPAYNLRIKYIILHYTALNDDLSFKVLTDPGVSAHYLITTKKDEPIYKLVDDGDRAWHAGITMFDNRYSMNDSSIGIEIVNLGFLKKVTNTYEELNRMTQKQRDELFFTSYDEYIEFEDSQIEKVAYLLKELIEKYQIKPYNILGHSDIAPYRKKDPGPKFPWKRLHDEYNLGMWYDEYDYSNFLNDDEYKKAKVMDIKEEFIKYGYTSMPTNNVWDLDSRKVLYAFQCHFRPEKIDGNIDNETYAVIRALNLKVKKINEMDERSKANNFLTNTFFTNIFISNNIVSTNWNYNTNRSLRK
ncbi:N-acetylmuramoyl-L-alanine amidase [Brachyspira intermedia]|uniref:N-acetylmuramoyl-L-alanine amidase n=1 Tax=Brachyspira intermedia TaxID=84377 RepID=UPI002633F39A|nr:N-acetylmuramoyl-L-alanine amidase [uncultured Brachyspira sp.]